MIRAQRKNEAVASPDEGCQFGAFDAILLV